MSSYDDSTPRCELGTDFTRVISSASHWGILVSPFLYISFSLPASRLSFWKCIVWLGSGSWLDSLSRQICVKINSWPSHFLTWLLCLPYQWYLFSFNNRWLTVSQPVFSPGHYDRAFDVACILIYTCKLCHHHYHISISTLTIPAERHHYLYLIQTSVLLKLVK